MKKKIMSGFLLVAMVVSLCVPVFALEVDTGSKYIEALEKSQRAYETDITVDDLMKNSTITYADSSSKSGHYKGDSQILAVTVGNVVVLPDFTWTHTVEFDWTAKLNSEGDYVFNTISNANSSVTPGTHLLYLDVESSEARDVYSFSADRKTVTFSSKYELQWRYYNEIFTTNAIAELERVIKMQELI